MCGDSCGDDWGGFAGNGALPGVLELDEESAVCCLYYSNNGDNGNGRHQKTAAADGESFRY